MRRNCVLWILCTVVLCGIGFPVLGSEIEVGLEPFLVVLDSEKDEEHLEPTEQARPGDVLEYLLWAKNASEETAEGLILVGPVPDHTKLHAPWYEAILAFLDTGEDAPVLYVRKAEGEEPEPRYMGEDALPEFSMDDGETFALPPVKVEVDGETQRATADMFSHVRWMIGPLLPGQRAEIRYRIQVP